MKTPEEIKRGMEHCAEIGCKGCPYEEDCKMFDGFSIPAEDAYFYIQQLEQDNARKDERIRQLEQRVPRWISVKERLPEGGCLAANFCKGTYGYGEYIIGYVSRYNELEAIGDTCKAENSYELLDNVTHWMPLPEPPEEE